MVTHPASAMLLGSPIGSSEGLDIAIQKRSLFFVVWVIDYVISYVMMLSCCYITLSQSPDSSFCFELLQFSCFLSSGTMMSFVLFSALSWTSLWSMTVLLGPRHPCLLGVMVLGFEVWYSLQPLVFSLLLLPHRKLFRPSYLRGYILLLFFTGMKPWLVGHRVCRIQLFLTLKMSVTRELGISHVLSTQNSQLQCSGQLSTSSTASCNRLRCWCLASDSSLLVSRPQIGQQFLVNCCGPPFGSTNLLSPCVPTMWCICEPVWPPWSEL